MGFLGVLGGEKLLAVRRRSTLLDRHTLNRHRLEWVLGLGRDLGNPIGDFHSGQNATEDRVAKIGRRVTAVIERGAMPAG